MELHNEAKSSNKSVFRTQLRGILIQTILFRHQIDLQPIHFTPNSFHI